MGLSCVVCGAKVVCAMLAYFAGDLEVPNLSCGMANDALRFGNYELELGSRTECRSFFSDGFSLII